MSAQAGSQPESAYEEFVIAHDYTCDFCTDLSYDYPDGLAKHDVLSREQWWAIMSRLNAAYAPGCSDCLRYAWILLILPVVCLCCECISGCFGCARHNRLRRLRAAVQKENAKLNKDNTRIPVEFLLLATPLADAPRSTPRTPALVLGVGKKPAWRSVVGNKARNNRTVITAADDNNNYNNSNDNNNGSMWMASSMDVQASSYVTCSPDPPYSSPSMDQSNSSWSAPSMPDTTSCSPPEHHHHVEPPQQHHCHE